MPSWLQAYTLKLHPYFLYHLLSMHPSFTLLRSSRNLYYHHCDISEGSGSFSNW